MAPITPIRIVAILVRMTRRNVVRGMQTTVAPTIPIRIADIRSSVLIAHRSSNAPTVHLRGRILRPDHRNREAIQRREHTLDLRAHHVRIPRRAVPILRRAVLQGEPLRAVAADRPMVVVAEAGVRMAVVAAATAAVQAVVTESSSIKN